MFTDSMRGGGLDRGRPILLVPTVDDPFDPRVADRMQAIADEHRAEGYDVVVSDSIRDEGADELLRDWLESKSAETDEALEDLLERYDLYGILHVSDTYDSWLVRGSVIWSQRSGAENRRFAVAPMASLPYLLVNDHPTKHDPEVAAEIDRSIIRYQVRGLPVVVDSEFEASVRAEMPTGPIGVDTPMPDRIHILLARRGLGGIVYVVRGEGEERVAVRRIDAKDVPSGVDPASMPEQASGPD